MSRTGRYHDLDALRAAAMFLGILIHGLLPFTRTPIPFWPVHDPQSTPLADAAIFAIHGFRMQAFFLIAGFFGAMLRDRYGLRGFLRRRFLRVAVPLALGLLFINAPMQYFWLIGDPRAIKAVQAARNVPEVAADADEIAGHYTSGRFLLIMPPMHLWFLYYLIVLCAAVIPFVLLGRTASGRAAAARLQGVQEYLLRKWFGPAVLGILLLPPLWTMRHWLIDTPEGWTPNVGLLAYYFLFFGFGWLLWGRRELLPLAGRRWRLHLALATFPVLPIYAALMLVGMQRLGRPPEYDELPELKVAALFAEGTYTWLMIFGLLGLFHRYFQHPRPWVRYLADSSYWCYLASLIPLLALQMAAAPRDWPLPAKLAFVNLGAVGILLLSYEYLVRHSIVGTVLNGRKSRRPRDSDPT